MSRWTPRAEYQGLRAYDVDPSSYELELADNTSQFGAPPAARRILRAMTGDRLARYPTTYSRELREAIARYVGVNADEVMVGCGSDEVMTCTFRALGTPGDRVAYMDPTFVMTKVFAQTNSLKPVAVPLLPSGDLDADALLAVRAPLSYVCTPNNPTGVPIARPVLDRVLRDAAGVVLVDEAYAEFAGTNIASEAPAHGDVLVFRTFSKALALAGLRVGFAVGARRLIAELEKARGPYTVTAASEAVALAVLREDLGWVADRVAEVIDARTRFAAGLERAGFAPFPSAANFLLIPVADAEGAARALGAQGILVRHFPALPVVGDALRITVGARATMERVLEAMLAEPSAIAPARRTANGAAAGARGPDSGQRANA